MNYHPTSRFRKCFQLAGIAILVLSAGQISHAAGEIELDCYKSAQKNGLGYHFRLPKDVDQSTSSFSCEATIEPVKLLPDQGLRAVLMLSDDPAIVARTNAGIFYGGIEFFKGISLHGAFSADGKQLDKYDNWQRLPADTPVNVKLEYVKDSKALTLRFSSKGNELAAKTFPIGQRGFKWKYFSLVSLRPSGDQELKAPCIIRDFKIDGQELQSAEFTQETVKEAGSEKLDAEFNSWLDREVRPKLPKPGVPLFNTFDWRNIPCRSFSYAGFETVEVKDRSFTSATRMTGLKKPITFHTVQIASKRNEQPIRKGDVIFMRLDARCLKSTDESGDGKITMSLVVDGNTWSSFGSLGGNVNREWKTLYACAVSPNDYPPGKVRLHFFLSALQQTIEFGGIAALNLGKDVDTKLLPSNKTEYLRPSQEWRKQAHDNIEKYRKGKFTVRVMTPAGTPIQNAKVHVKMQKHAFGFGCYTDDAPLLDQGERFDKFREWFLKLFNQAIVPTFWGPGTPSGGYGWENPPYRKRYLEIAEWCHRHGLRTQGHTLVWPCSMYVPPEVVALKGNPVLLQKRINEHIGEVISAFGVTVDEWQVLNEPLATKEFSDIVGVNGVVEWFKIARKHAPHAPLLINDNGILSKYKEKRENYERLISELSNAGAPIDGIGFQGHIGTELPNPEVLQTVFDSFARLGKKLYVTEFTVGIDDEEIQAEYTRDFLTAFFSHPSAASLTMWGFWAGKHYSRKCAMFRPDWSIKPNGKAYIDLVLKEWWTDVQGVTAEDGTFQTRAFYGNYLIEVNHKDKTISQSIFFSPENARPVNIDFD